MRSRYFPKFTSENGSTLAEVCIAIVVMTIVVIGGFQFVSVGRERLAVEKYYRLALMEAASRLESARKYSYVRQPLRDKHIHHFGKYHRKANNHCKQY